MPQIVINSPISKFFKNSNLSRFNVDSVINQVIQAKDDGTLNSLTNVNKKLVEYAQKTDAAKISAQGFYKTQIDMSGSITGTFKTIQQYNNLVSNKRDTVAFTDAVSELNKDLGGTLKGLNGAKASAGTYTQALSKATAQTVAMTVKTIAFNAALTIGLSIAISAIVSGIEYLSHLHEKQLEKIEKDISALEEETEAYNDEKEAIDSLVDSYSKIALSSDDLGKSKEELTSIQEKLIEKFGEEAKSLDLINGKYSENIALIQKQRVEEAKAFVDKNEANYNTAKERLENGSKTVGNDFIYTGVEGKNYTEFKSNHLGNWSSFKEIIEKYDNLQAYYDDTNTLLVSGTLEEQVDTLNDFIRDLTDIYDDLNDNQKEWLSDLVKGRDDLEKELARDKVLVETFEKNVKLSKGSEDLPDSIKDTIDKAQEYAQSIVDSSDSAEIFVWSEAIKSLKEQALNDIDDNDVATKETVESTFDDIESLISEKTQGINSLLDGYNLNIKKFKDETYSKVNEKLSKLDSVRNTLLQGESISASDVKELIDIDANLADKFTKTANGYTVALSDIETARNNFANSTKETIQKEIEENEKWIKNKEKEIEEIKKGYSITSASDIKSPSDAAEYSAYSKEVEQINKDILAAEENTANWKTMLDLLFNQPVEVNSKSSAEKIKEYSNALAEYAKGGSFNPRQGFLYDVNTYANKMGDRAANFTNLVLDKNGKISRKLSSDELKEYAEQILNGGEDYLKLRVGFEFTGDGAEESARKVAGDIENTLAHLLDSAYNLFGWGSNSFEPTAFLDEVESIENEAKSIQEVIDLIDEGIYNDEAWSLAEAHPELVEVIDDTDKLRDKLVELRDTAPNNLINFLENLRKTLKDKSQIKSIDNIIAKLKKLPESIAGYNEIITKLKRQVKLYDEKIAALEKEKDKQSEILEALNKQKEALEEIISKYESAANAVTNAIDKEIDALEDEKKLIEDTYNAEIDALKAENEERDRANDLREKELALAKAKNSMVRVYDKERGGFIIQANSEEIAKAQKEYDDAVNDNRIAELEAQRDAEVALIDEKIEAYEKYKEAWQDAIDAYNHMQDELNAAAILGYGWREAVMAKDTSLIDSFAINYAGFQNQLHTVIEPQIEDTQNIIDKYDEEIKKYEKLKKQQEDYLSFYEEYSIKFTKATEQQTAALREFTEALRDGKSMGVVSKLFETVFKSFAGFSKGGIVDFTGPAMLHGSPSNPEMVLNNQQISTLWKLLSTGQTEQMNRFMNSAPSVFSGRSDYQHSFDGTPNFADRHTMERIASQQCGNIDNSTTFVITGNDIRAKDYDEFKGYMDRYIREANMNRLVGKK